MAHNVLNSATHTNPVAPFHGAVWQPQGGPPWSLPPRARISDTDHQHYDRALPSTTAPLTQFSNNVTLESMQGYHGVSIPGKSASMPFHPQLQPQFRVHVHPSFAQGSKATPPTRANEVGTPKPKPKPTLTTSVHAHQPQTSLVLLSHPSIPFSTSITTSTSSIIPPSAPNVDAQRKNPHLGPSSMGGAHATTCSPPLLKDMDEMNEDPPPLLPPAAPSSPLRKPRAQGSKVRKVMDNVPLENDTNKLQQRLKEQGGDEDAIAHVPTVFANGVSKKALRLRRRKTGGGKSIDCSQGYMYFVGRRQVKKEKENETGVYYEDEWWCRLCPSEDRISYVAFKNLLPHLCSKHFGLPGRGKIRW